jgi:hypothetical protein
MASFLKIAAGGACVTVLSGTAILGQVHSCAEGNGVPQDYGEAVRWYRKAAEQGCASAQYALGFMYDQGRRVPRDHFEAVRWLRKAAEQGNEAAEAGLMLMYYRGQGAPQNYAEAARWGSKVLGKAVAHCFVKINVVHGRWTSILSILLLLSALVPQRRWGRATWLPFALISTGSAVGLVYHLLIPATFGHALLTALYAGVSVYGGAGIAVKLRESRDGAYPDQPPIAAPH